jgi:hypothetical protein
LRVLAVDLFDAFGNNQLNTGPLFGIRRRLARRAATFRKAGDDHGKAALLNLVLLYRAVAHADVDVLTQRFVIIKTDPPRRDLVRRNIVH